MTPHSSPTPLPTRPLPAHHDHSETSTAVNSRAPSPTPSHSTLHAHDKHAKLSPPSPFTTPAPVRETEDRGADLDLARRFESRASAERAEAEAELEKGAGAVHRPPAVGPLTLAPEDAANPKNWTAGRKWTVDFVLSLWTLSLTYSSTAYVASLGPIEAKFGLSQEVALLGVTLNVAGFAAGPLVAGPSSELYGRRAVYIVSAVLYTAFVAGVCWAPNAPALLIFRFLAGFCGSAAINNVPATIADITTLEERTIFSVPYAVMAFGGPTLGPLCSNFIQTAAGIDWNFRVSFIYTVLTSVAVMLLPETHGPTILRRRMKREGVEVDKPTFGQVVNTYVIALKRPMEFLFLEPIVTLVCIYLSLLYGILYGYFEGLTVVYEEIRGFTPNENGLTYVSLGIGFLIGAALLATVGHGYYVKQAKLSAAKGLPNRAEARLLLAFPGAFLAPISLFLFAWTAPYTRVHWIVPCIAETLFAISMVFVFSSYIPYLSDIAGPMAASALAAGMTSRALVAAAFPLFSLQMYHKLGVAGAVSLLAGLCCLLVPLPFVFTAYGSRLRARSKRLVT